jgi:hypothetical protein
MNLLYCFPDSLCVHECKSQLNSNWCCIISGNVFFYFLDSYWFKNFLIKLKSACDIPKNLSSCTLFYFYCIILWYLKCFIFIFSILGFELRVFTLSHSTSTFFVIFFLDRVSWIICLGLALNHDPPNFYFLSS